MNPLNKWILSAAALMLLPLQAAAQSVTVGSDSGAGGDALVIPVTFVAGADIAGLDLDVTFDASQFSSASASCASNTACAGAFTNCSISPAGTANFILAAGAACVSGQLGTISLTIDNAATAGVKPLTVTVIGLSDSEGTDLALDTLGVTDGAVTVIGAAAAYTSVPAPGALNVGPVVQNDTDPSTNVLITNSGAASSTLTGTCSETSDPSNVFTVSGTTAFEVLQGDPGDTVTVTCDSAGAIDTHTGTMECTHNGDNIASPAVYNLSCTITASPQPAYSSNPAPGAVIDLGPTDQGEPDPSALVSITNIGDPGTTLTGTCGVTGDPEISVSDGAFSVTQGGAADIQTVSCDASAPGSFSATLSCSHDGSNASPATYTVNCEIAPPGQAVFASTPAPGAIDMTPGDAVPEGSPNPTSPLTFFNNADPGDTNLSIACSLAGDPQITVAPDISGGIVIAGGGSSGVTFTCDATTAGNYAATYTCPYDTDGVEGDDGSAQYSVTCDVRTAAADVVPNPADGTPLMGLADAGGSFVYNVMFTEVNDEGIDGSLDNCSLADGTNFAITSPTFPATISAGGSVTVTVTGTDPDDGSTSVSDTLNCTYFDSDNTEVGTDVSYPLTLQIGGGGVIFEVTKAFTHGYDGEVTVFLTCDTGLPLQQQFNISPDLPVFFVVTEFESGAMDCSVTEGTESGFEPTYLASGDSESDDDDSQSPGCHFFNVAGGARNLCEITNSPAPVDVVIEKEWVIQGSVGEEVIEQFFLTLICDAEIVGGAQFVSGLGTGAAQTLVNGDWYLNFAGTGNSIFEAEVIPEFPSSNCSVEELVSTSGVEVDNGCTGIVVSLNQGASCLITNTVFFEGIPTLSQWGMAIMALLMLGVGMVGFRRFT
jgi:hypothetical protein